MGNLILEPKNNSAIDTARYNALVEILNKEMVKNQHEILKKFCNERDNNGTIAARDYIKSLFESKIFEDHTYSMYKKIVDSRYKEREFTVKNKDKKPKVSLTGLKIDNFLDNANILYEIKPYFYDKTGIWWIWKDNRWEITDDTDMTSMLDKNLGFMGQTVNSSTRNNHLNAMMWVGREKIPKDAPKKWIQFKDKAFSLKSNNTYLVTKDFFFTNPIPWELSKSPSTPTMDKLFEEWVGKDYVQSLYEIIAYCCYSDYPIQTLICLYGAGRNGKTCFLRLLCKFLGKDNTCSTELDTLLDSRFESFKLFKKLCCIMGETNFGVLDRSSMLKKLTGSDMIGFEKKGKDPFNDYSYAKLIIASNSLPSSNDTSDGFYRRWFIIDFPNQFKEGKDILEDIPDEEYRNLATKCMAILPGLLKRGEFHNQGSIEQRKLKYVLSSNPLPYFIENYCLKDTTFFISYNELYTNYVTFLTKNKRRIVKMKEFREALTQEGFFIERCSKKIGDEFVSGNYVLGLKVKDDFVKIMQIMNDISLQPFSYIEKLETVHNLHNLHKKEDLLVQEELVLPFNWDSKLINWVKCTIEGCNETECNFDSYGVPYCKKHWEECACK